MSYGQQNDLNKDIEQSVQMMDRGKVKAVGRQQNDMLPIYVDENAKQQNQLQQNQQKQ